MAQAKEVEEIFRIIEEYGLDKASAHDNTLEKQAKGWRILHALKEEATK